MNVLIVDDQRLSRVRLIKMIDWDALDLTLAGEYSDGQEALEFLQNSACDIVITDIRMPNMDGLQLAEKTAEFNPNIIFIIVSGFDEFIYTRKSIQLAVTDYILKPVNKQELNDRLKMVKDKHEKKLQSITDAKRKLAEQFFYAILGNGYDRPTQLLEYFSDLEFAGLDEPLYPILLEGVIDVPQIRHFLQNNGISKYVLLETRGLHLLISWIDLQSKDTLIQTIKRLCDLPLYGSILAGPLIDGMQLLDQALHQLFEAFSIRKCLPAPESFVELETASIERLTISAQSLFHHSLEQEWFEQLQSNQSEKAMSLLRSILDQLHTKPSSSLSALDVYITYLLVSGTKILFECGFIDDRKFPIVYKLASDISRVLYVQNKAHMVLDYFQGCISVNHADQDSELSMIITKVKAYVNQYFCENISLTDIAKMHYISVGYLSMIFKQKIGITFVEYLTTLRMNHAQILLSTGSDLKIYEVAAMCGYQDIKYFRSLFKRHVGSTPQRYKERRSDDAKNRK